MAKEQPRLTEVTVSHAAGGAVSIRSYGNEKSDYSIFQSRKWVFPEDWTEEQIEKFVEEKRKPLRDLVDALADAEHKERFAQSYLSTRSEDGY